MGGSTGNDEINRLDFENTGELIDDVLYDRNWLLRENANTRLSPSVIDMHIASQLKKRYALEKLYSKEVANAHIKGIIHIHDLSEPFKPYCNGIDGRIFLMDGLKFPDSRSAPAKQFNAAMFHAMSFMLHSQQFFAGAQAIDMFNWLLAPHLHYSDIDEEQLLRIVQGFMFQMNQSNRIGAQSAFTNIGLRINCPSSLKNEYAVYDGKFIDRTYSEFEEEARAIYNAFMEIAASGDADGLPFTFPLITTAITKDLDLEDPLWKKTMYATSSTGAPYFLNLTTDYLEENTVQAMCCRLLARHSGGVWTAGGMGSGSNKIVTVNLPGIALETGDIDGFFDRLDEILEITRKALLEGQEIVRKSLYEWKILPWLLQRTENDLPYFDFDSRHLTFGVVGLNECLLNLKGESMIEQHELGMKIIRHMLARIETYSREDGIEYTFEQTPAESTAHRLAMLDRSRFGDKAHVQGTDRDAYYTNSTHVPYSSSISLAEKINIEAAFHPYFTGGTISHIWMGESFPDPEGMSELIQKLAGTDLAYFCFSPDFSVCENRHVSRGMNLKCPICNKPAIDHVSRVTGYFGHVKQWNPGKQKEYEERHRYNLHEKH
ncbi:anaerobic ribonucleoside-triphosphate reductase [Methanococcoides methylutens]|uniref:Ribonucleotide reductase of class III (Anaerobic), large subunit n=1 Tax=Methanococcoides methylutens MM1 TaxID=1434104 RepID=A0A0E3X0L2_METMT|nr:anaerobic ribonucleoside-triphosphate reductase [Methanococcoides methylutens]AKB84384.1 Ribonucleotide reductase of class III (anaerobic), large subunit [Methanococcoides methylutens MM1]